MKRLMTICAVVMLFSAGYAMAGTWKTLDAPGAVSTYAIGIDGSNVVGVYYDNAGGHGFLYNGTTWTTLDAPWASGGQTWAYGIDGSNIVGGYLDNSGAVPNDVHGFRYDGTWTSINMPGVLGTNISGISGNKLVGSYAGGSFFYDGSNWTTLAAPGALATWVAGIKGNNIFGRYDDSTTSHGFIYDETNWTPIDAPMGHWTVITGIDGDNLIGQYWDASNNDYAFLYDGIKWTIIAKPGAIETVVNGISGNFIVGTYDDTTGSHGFVYEIPEPATILLLGLGGLMLRRN